MAVMDYQARWGLDPNQAGWIAFGLSFLLAILLERKYRNWQATQLQSPDHPPQPTRPVNQPVPTISPTKSPAAPPLDAEHPKESRDSESVSSQAYWAVIEAFRDGNRSMLDYIFINDAPYDEFVSSVVSNLHDNRPPGQEIDRLHFVRWSFAGIGLFRAVNLVGSLITASHSSDPILRLNYPIGAARAESVFRFVLGYWLWLICSDEKGSIRPRIFSDNGGDFFEAVFELWLLTDSERDICRELETLHDTLGHPVLVMQELVERGGAEFVGSDVVSDLAAAVYVKDQAYDFRSSYYQFAND